MDGGVSDLEFLLAAARQELETLREDPRLAKPRGKRGEALRDHVLDLLGAVEHRMTGVPSANAPEPVRRAFARSLRQGLLMLRGGHAALPWLAATRAPNLNLGSLYMTEEYARSLVAPDVDLVVVPDPEYMYATTSWPFSAVITMTPGFTPSTTRRPIVLNYPLSDSDRLLLHPIFAHELGHASADEHQLTDTVQTALDADSSFTDAFQQAVDDIAVTYPSLAKTQVAGLLRNWLHSWIEELLCDHLALEASGPAFLWAFAMFVMPLSYGEPSTDHPPNTLRVRLALDHLDRRGWRPYMEAVAPGVTGWLDEIATDAGSGAMQPQHTFLRDQLLTHAVLFQDAAIARIGADALDPAACHTAAHEAAELLSRLILPVGLDQPLTSHSILLGGWQHAFSEHGDNPSGMVTALADQRLQDLVGKAIEMSTVTLAWDPS